MAIDAVSAEYSISVGGERGFAEQGNPQSRIFWLQRLQQRLTMHATRIERINEHHRHAGTAHVLWHPARTRTAERDEFARSGLCIAEERNRGHRHLRSESGTAARR